MTTIFRNHILMILILVMTGLAMLSVGPLAMKAMAEDEIEVGTAAAFRAVVADLNANGGSKTIKLTDDVALVGDKPEPEKENPQLRKGELTILGEGHTLTITISILDNGKLNLGRDGYEKSLDVIKWAQSDLCVINTDQNGQVNIYKGVTIRDAYTAGQAGGITSVGNSVVNMYGGTITNCSSPAVSGGIYLDGHSVFNMYDGEITKCTGSNGGAIGLSGGSAIGPSTAGPVSFNMYGGTISDCTDDYQGGGAVCAYSWYPVSFNMYGGKIENCKSVATSRYAYGGGAISLFTINADLTFNMEGGEITGNSCLECNRGYGGGILIYATGSGTDIQFKGGKITKNSANFGGGYFLFSGKTTFADGFGLHNNSASLGGDDIYNNGADVTLGTVDTTATLESCGHKITGWYEDAEERWSYPGCASGEEHLELFTKTGTVCSEEFGLKAAHGKLFDVIWMNGDKVLETDTNVPSGSMPEYNGAEPTKKETAQYTYSFAGWTPEISKVTGDATYKAVFDPIPRKYTVDFDSQGGTVVANEVVPYGGKAQKPNDPTRNGYSFLGWFMNGKPYDFNSPVTKNETIVARWARNEENEDDPDNGGGNGGNGGNRGGNNGNNAGRPAAAAPAAPVAQNPPANAVIEDNNPPLNDGGTIIDDEPVPQSAPKGHWALINLICTVLTILGAAGLATRRRKDDEDEETNRKRNLFKIGAAICAIISIIVLFLTEDFTQPMQMLDLYTILMIVILAVCAVFIMLYKILSPEPEGNEE